MKALKKELAPPAGLERTTLQLTPKEKTTAAAVRAAREYRRLVQMSRRSRSSPALQEAVQKLKSGEFGEVYMARALCFMARNTIGKTPVEPVPPGSDYDMWTGPAPLQPFTKNRFHYARWGLGVTHPTKVTAIGGKFMFDDDQETPNTIYGSEGYLVIDNYNKYYSRDRGGRDVLKC